MMVSNDNHRKYARYAAHCLEIVHADADFCATQREMADEWLRLVEATLHPIPTLWGTEFPPAVAPAVLVVDDDPLVLDVTALMLEDLGCEVITAPSAKEA